MPLPTDPFDVQNVLFSGLTLIVLKLQPLAAATAATDTVTITGHTLVDGQALTYVSGTGFTGLTAGSTYYVRDVASNTFKLSATKGGSALTPGTSSAGIFRPTEIFGSKLLTSKLTQEEKAYERPDAGGVIREARTVLTKQTESFTFEIDEVKRLPLIFNGGLAGRVTGDAVLYCPDPDDETGSVAMKSEEFACTITRDGDLPIGNSEFSKATFNLKSNKLGIIEWETDVAVA